VHSRLADRSELDWAEVPRWPLVVNVASGTTGPWSWPAGEGPETVVETTNFDEWIESVAADRGIGVIPDVAVRRNIHPRVRFIALRGAPESPVLLAFLPHARNAVLRRFLEASAAAVADSPDQLGDSESSRSRAGPMMRLCNSSVSTWIWRVSSVLVFSSNSWVSKSWSALACWKAA